MSAGERDQVVVGRITGVYGVRGWLKIFSDTDPRENILRYRPWRIRQDGEWRTVQVDGGRVHGKGLVAHVVGYDTPEHARTLMGAEIAVAREQLPPLGPDEYYWADLIGLRVVTREGIELGRVSQLMETGANDVLVIKGERERLIPFTPGHAVAAVDLAAGEIRVDWDPEF